MSPITKYEAIGIFASVAVMALVLAFLRTDGTNPGITSDVKEISEAAVIVAGDDTSGDAALADALFEAATESGELEKLVIDDVRIGTGEAVKEGDTVTVDYIGSTQDGIQFDSSYARGDTFTFTVGGGQVIPGWEVGLIGMKVGGQRILVIPSAMAYGNQQVGPIPPNSVLVFAVELREIN